MNKSSILNVKFLAIAILFFLFLYFILAFFLKSKYPLSEYMFNGVDAYDVIKDALGLASPFAIAYIIYQIWHSQKGREAIAIESQNLLKNILEEVSLISSLRYETQLHMQAIQEKVDRLNTLTQVNFRSILYLESCIDDLAATKSLNRYLYKSTQVYVVIRNCSDQAKDPQSFIKVLGLSNNSLDIFVGEVDDLIKELAPITTFQKIFKLKKFN